MQVSKRLKRPVHRLRFTIASTSLLPVDGFNRFAERLKKKASSWEEFLIPPGTYFMVMDVLRYGNTTQVLLLHFPDWAYPLSKEHGFELTNIKPTMRDGTKLVRFAENDFLMSLSGVVHGHSLKDTWVDAMRQPVGLDDALNLNDLDAPDYVCRSEEESDFAEYAAALNAICGLDNSSKLSIPCLPLHCHDDLHLLFAQRVLKTVLFFLRMRMSQADVFLFCENEPLAEVYKEAGDLCFS